MLSLQGLVDTLGVALLQVIDIEAAIARFLQFSLRAEISPSGVVKLQIAAARVVERLDRLLIGDCKIVKDGIAVGICTLAHRIGFKPEVKSRRGRDTHLRSHLGVRLEELEMFQHRMVGKADLASNTD